MDKKIEYPGGVTEYAVAKVEIKKYFPIINGTVADSCAYCEWRSAHGGYCYFYRRSMADELKCRPYFCEFNPEEVEMR